MSDTDEGAETCWRFQCDNPAQTQLLSRSRRELPTCEDCAKELVENGRGWQYKQ